MFNLFNLSPNSFRYPFTKQQFILYKQVASQYDDPDILRYVNLLIPKDIKKEIKTQLKVDISKRENHINYDRISNPNHAVNDIGDKTKDRVKYNYNIQDDLSFIYLSPSFLNSLKGL